MRRWRQPIKQNHITPVMGLAIGVIFTCAGLVIFIPRLGSGGIYWTLASLIITISFAVQLFRTSEKEEEDVLPEHDFMEDFPHEENPVPPEEEENLDPVTRHLLELQSLYVQKVLTKEEYEQCVREVTEDDTKGKE